MSKEKEISQEEIDRMFNDIMSLKGENIIDFEAELDQMSEEERQITFKHIVDITKLEKEGKTDAEIQKIIEQAITDYRVEMRKRGLMK